MYLAGESGGRTVKKSLGKNEEGREVWKYVTEITCECGYIDQYELANKLTCLGCGKKL